MSEPATPAAPRGGMRRITAYAIGSTTAAARPTADWVIEEQALTIAVEEVGRYTLMWTPTESPHGAVGFTRGDGILADSACPEILALTAGFVFTEGLVDALSDIAHMAVCPDNPALVRVQLASPERSRVRRTQGVVTSSCGICGEGGEPEHGLQPTEIASDTLRLKADGFERLMTALQIRQLVFESTGGAHAAAVFDSRGEIVAAAEDLGRHNALDKVIGRCLLLGQPLSGCGVLLSSRLSMELVRKAARAGIELMAAISAPTSYAIELADRYGITLCGFVRGTRANVYTHPRRIVELAAEPCCNVT